MNAIHPLPDHPSPELQRRIGAVVSRSPLRSLWNLEGVPARAIAKHTWRSLLEDDLVGRAAELGFYFIFALFPSLFTVTSLLSLAARSASHFYYSLLEYLAVVIPHAAMGTVLQTFNETTSATTTGKLTFGLVFAIWSASVGFSAIQETLNLVYRVKETRSYLAARLSAVAVTIVLGVLITFILGAMLGADLLAQLAHLHVRSALFALALGDIARVAGWSLALILLSLLFAVIYYFAPDVRTRRWHWLSPGAAIGIVGWFLASLGLRLYLHFFDNYSVTYGGLGAVIILLTWFYLTGLMLLLGAEVNSQIEAAAAAKLMHTGSSAQS
jgi:membrane protein